jgi:cytochrome oxidase assembly protein ShyY1
MKVGQVGFRFEPEWRITLFTLIMVPLMFGLGLWQLGRAEEKATLAADWERQQVQPPAPVETLQDQPPEKLAYRPVTAFGRFRESEYLLLDNRTHGGRFGYEVLGILDLDQLPLAVVVNLGWVAADPARRHLPAIALPLDKMVFRGHVYIPPGKPYLLEEQEIGDDWPKLVQAIEMDKIVPAIGGGNVFPHLLRLERGSPGAMTVDWQVVNVSPDKHRGYAVQWFTMAAVLAIFYLLRSSNLWHWLSVRRSKSG